MEIPQNPENLKNEQLANDEGGEQSASQEIPEKEETGKVNPDLPAQDNSEATSSKDTESVSTQELSDEDVKADQQKEETVSPKTREETNAADSLKRETREKQVKLAVEPLELERQNWLGGKLQQLIPRYKSQMHSEPIIEVKKQLKNLRDWFYHFYQDPIYQDPTVENLRKSYPVIDQILVNALNSISELESLQKKQTKQFSSKKNNLNNRISELKNENQTLKRQKQTWESEKADYQSRVTLLKSDARQIPTLRKKVEYYEQYYYKSSSLEKQIQLLEGKVNTLQGKVNTLQKDKGELISELAHANRDKTKTTSFSDQLARNDILVQEYKQLKNQEFNSIIQAIFQFIVQGNPDLKKSRKEKIISIRSTLSDQIFLEGMKFFSEDQIGELSETGQEILTKLTDSFTDILAIPKTEQIPPSVHQQLQTLVQQAQHLSDKEKDLAALADRDTEDYLNFAVNRVSNSIYEALELTSEQLPPELADNITNLVKQSLCLIRQMTKAEPPGQFFASKQGEPFDPKLHEAALGFEDEGTVGLTVFPAYIVGERAFEKAQVTTIELLEEKPPEESEKSSHGSGKTSSAPSETEEKIKIEVTIKTKQDSLLTVLESQLRLKATDAILEKIRNINDPDTLEQLLKEVPNEHSYPKFENKLDKLLENLSE